MFVWIDSMVVFPFKIGNCSESTEFVLDGGKALNTILDRSSSPCWFVVSIYSSVKESRNSILSVRWPLDQPSSANIEYKLSRLVLRLHMASRTGDRPFSQPFACPLFSMSFIRDEMPGRGLTIWCHNCQITHFRCWLWGSTAHFMCAWKDRIIWMNGRVATVWCHAAGLECIAKNQVRNVLFMVQCKRLQIPRKFTSWMDTKSALQRMRRSGGTDKRHAEVMVEENRYSERYRKVRRIAKNLLSAHWPVGL